MSGNDTHDAAGGDGPPDADRSTGDGSNPDADLETVDYLDAEVNLFRPSTPFMRDHLRLIWTMFAAWLLVVFGPVTLTWIATDAMTSVRVLGFPLHYFLTAVGAPTGALVLSLVYARRRDRLDEKYGIEHGASPPDGDVEAAATDGGADR